MKQYILMLPLLVCGLALSGSSCNTNMPPADVNGEMRPMTFVIWTIGNDANGGTFPCMLDFVHASYYEIAYGTVNSSGQLERYPLNSTPSISSGQFTLNVPVKGYFTVQIRIEGDCANCCNSFLRGSNPPAACANKNGVPIFIAEKMYQYDPNKTPTIKPELIACRCSCP